MTTDIDLRTTFNTEAGLYHQIRPRYPDAIFDALIDTTQLRPDSRLLEIGAGTGQATEALAKRGYPIIAIELGDELARIGQKALERYSNVTFTHVPFETVDLPLDQFDLLYVATAIHWIDPEYRFHKPYQLLKAEGHMAIIGTVHISDEVGDEYFCASQPIYQRYKPGGKTTDHLPRLRDQKPYAVDASLFELVYFKPFIYEVAYTARAYSQLLNTYSPTLAMEAASRVAFLKEIETLIETRFDNSFVKHYCFNLTIAKKKPV